MATGTFNFALLNMGYTPLDILKATNLLHTQGYVTNVTVVSGTNFLITYSGTDTAADMNANLFLLLLENGIQTVAVQ